MTSLARLLLAGLAGIALTLPIAGATAPDETQKQLTERAQEAKKKLDAAQAASGAERQKMMQEHMKMMQDMMAQAQKSKPRDGATPEQKGEWMEEHMKLMHEMMAQMMGEQQMMMGGMRMQGMGMQDKSRKPAAQAKPKVNDQGAAHDHDTHQDKK
jgi:hypothetical protein